MRRMTVVLLAVGMMLGALASADTCVTFNAKCGEVDETIRTAESGSAIGELPVPLRKGYRFDGWYEKGSIWLKRIKRIMY